MKMIWKYQIELGRTIIDAKSGFRPLSVQYQGSQLCVWAVVDPEGQDKKFVIRTVGTGFNAAEAGDFIGTVQQGQFVWHVFWEPQT